VLESPSEISGIAYATPTIVDQSSQIVDPFA